MIPQFALRLIVGLGLTWALLPRKLITSGFFRIQMLVTLGLSVLATLTVAQWSELESPTSRLSPGGWQGVLVACALISFVGSVLWTLERRRGGTIAGGLLLCLATGLLLAAPTPGDIAGLGIVLHRLDRLSSAWLLGGMTGTMLLGHWYLTATGMSLVPLQRGARWMQCAVLARTAVALTGLLLAPADVREAVWRSHSIWMLLRWGAGLAGPVVLAWMTPGTLKYRNTQSATGVLFAAVILTFIGEAAALLLQQELHWPL